MKKDDEKFILAAISGISKMSYKKCLKEIYIIEKELDNLFKNTKKNKSATRKHPFDKTGESLVRDIYYNFNDGSSAGLVCTNWTDNMIREYPGMYDHLRLKLSTGEFANWMRKKLINNSLIMKKLLAIVVLSLLFCNSGFTDEAKYSSDSLNKNITDYGWEIDESKLLKVGNTTLEIYTLEKSYKKKDWILKCQIAYYISSSSTNCRMP